MGMAATPADKLHISSLSLRMRVMWLVWCARIFGFWKSSYKDAAAAVEEMTLKDISYWVYKCRYPVKASIWQTRASYHTWLKSIEFPSDFVKKQSATFGAAGDLLRTQDLDNSKDTLYEGISDLLFDQDISFANLESPVTNGQLIDEKFDGVSVPLECCSPKQFDIMRGHAGRVFTVLNVANNHILDMGIEGVLTTQSILDKEGIKCLGINRDKSEYGCGRILIRNGIKFGFVSATLGTNGHVLPEKEAYRVNAAKLCPKNGEPDLELLKMQIDDCKKHNCDFIIASLHWGYEFEFFPRESQKETAHKLVEYGADSIIGHHPHVMQPIEYYRTKRDPNRVVVIAYSLGSLLWGYTSPHIASSAILNMTISKGLNEGSYVTYIEEVKAIPVICRHVKGIKGDHILLEKMRSHEAHMNYPISIESAA